MSFAYQTDVLRTLREALDGRPPSATLVYGRGCTLVSDWLDPAGSTFLMSADRRDIPPSHPDGYVGLDKPHAVVERVICRLPRSKEELHYLSSLFASLLPEGGELWVAGHMREGIKSAARVLEERVGPVSTVRTKRRTRVLVARRDPRRCEALTLEETRRVFEVEAFGTAMAFCTLVGDFAHGKLDGGTARLLARLASEPPRGAVLDLGSGAGVLGLCTATLTDVRSVDLVEVLWPGIEAARLNETALKPLLKAEVKHHLASVSEAPPGPFDVILTNPPFHDGKGEDRRALENFAKAAQSRLKERGVFWVVANRHLGYRDPLERHFAAVEVSWEDGLFRVWRCSKPRK